MIAVFDCKTGVWSEKYNFVDHKGVLVGYDSSGQCCESFGYRFLSSDKETELSFPYMDKDKYFLPDVEFDPERVEEVEEETEWGDRYCMARFGIIHSETKKLQYWLELYNHHNGYYGHGWGLSTSVKKKGGTL